MVERNDAVRERGCGIGAAASGLPPAVLPPELSFAAAGIRPVSFPIV